MKVILHGIKPEDFIRAKWAFEWMSERPKQRDAILSYDSQGDGFLLYAVRNKASITIRNITQ